MDGSKVVSSICVPTESICWSPQSPKDAYPCLYTSCSVSPNNICINPLEFDGVDDPWHIAWKALHLWSADIPGKLLVPPTPLGPDPSPLTSTNLAATLATCLVRFFVSWINDPRAKTMVVWCTCVGTVTLSGLTRGATWVGHLGSSHGPDLYCELPIPTQWNSWISK